MSTILVDRDTDRDIDIQLDISIAGYTLNRIIASSIGLAIKILWRKLVT